MAQAVKLVDDAGKPVSITSNNSTIEALLATNNQLLNDIKISNQNIYALQSAGIDNVKSVQYKGTVNISDAVIPRVAFEIQMPNDNKIYQIKVNGNFNATGVQPELSFQLNYGNVPTGTPINGGSSLTITGNKLDTSWTVPTGLVFKQITNYTLPMVVENTGSVSISQASPSVSIPTFRINAIATGQKIQFYGEVNNPAGTNTAVLSYEFVLREV